MRIVLALTIAALAGTTLSAHRRDEYLQAARLAVQPRVVELQVDLTPGIDVADSIIGEIDRDRNGSLSADEQQAYAAAVLNALELRVDGHPQHVAGAVATFPDLDELRGGVGTIHLRTHAQLPRLRDGDHELVFHNRYRPDVSVYLANALVPDGDTIVITAQRRDPAQRELTIAYVVRNQSRTSTPVWVIGVLGGMLFVTLRARR